MPLLNRKQSERTLVVAFDSTASALAFASSAQAAGLGGRLIPVPRSLSAGCGIAWRDLPANRKHIESIIAAEAIDDAQLHEMQIL